METLAPYIIERLRIPRERAFAERLGAPEWRTTANGRMLERATAIAYALRDAGVAPGDRVALISENRLDWIAVDFGILLAGAVPLPSYATLALDQLDFIFADAKTKLAFVESSAFAERVAATCPHAPALIRFDGAGPGTLAAFEARGAELAAADPARLATFTAGIAPDDLAVLIYTSGTTGNPKGVMLTHGNLIACVSNAYEHGLKAHATEGNIVLSVLPFAHIFEHTDILIYMLAGYDIYVTQPDFLIADMQSVHPWTLSLVPRIFERILNAIMANAKAAGGERAQAVPWALGIARQYAEALDAGHEPAPELTTQYRQASAAVIAPIRASLGLDRVHHFISGSAPLHRDVALTFAGMGMPILEGYGLTETSPTLTVNTLEHLRYGSVGKAIPGVELRIADDGEILARGPNVMKGYYRVPGGFTPDGWFMTGDIGHLDADGFLFITDRKKELLKTSGGKYVAPSRVESAIRRSALIGQVFVIGDERPFPIALVAPDWAAMRAQFGIPADVSTTEIARRDDVLDVMLAEVTARTADMASYEQIRRIVLLPRDLTIADGELSATLKIKRRVVEQKFAELIESAYTQPPPLAVAP